MGIYDVDVDELRIDLGAATERALDLADELATVVEAGADARTLLVAAARYREEVRHARGLRRELKTAVAG